MIKKMNFRIIEVINYKSVGVLLKVRETIYILGLGVPGLRPPTEGEEPLPVLKVFNLP